MTTLSPPVLTYGSLEELLQRCARHEEAAFAEYYRVTSPVLNTLLIRRGQTRSRREATLAKVYVAIWRQADDWAYDQAPSAWGWTLMILGRIDGQAGSEG